MEQVSGSGEDLSDGGGDGEVGGVAEDGLSQDGVSFISIYIKLSQRGLCRSYMYLINVRETRLENHTNIYLVMELVQGGELFALLRRMKQMEESEAKFYVSQVLLALEYLHNLDIIYRDLKLENLLIDSRGFIKLIDFGFAKRVDSSTKSWTLCGTPDYLAPEVILAQ